MRRRVPASTRRYPHFQNTFALDAAQSPARRARFLDHLPRALARRTRSRDREKSLLVGHLAAAAARPARRHPAARLRANSLARLAIFAARQADFRRHARGRVLKAQRHVVAQIGPALSAGASFSRAAPRPAEKRVIHSEKVAQDVLELFKDGRVEPRRFESPVSQARVPEAVVHRALLRIG